MWTRRRGAEVEENSVKKGKEGEKRGGGEEKQQEETEMDEGGVWKG